MKRVVIVDDGYDDYEIERAALSPVGAELVLRPCRGCAEAVAKAIRDADAVLVRESPVTAAAIAGAPRLRCIVRYGIGVDNIDRGEAARRQIYVANVPDYGTEDVSDHALALLLAVARRIVPRDRSVRAGGWNIARAEPMYRLAGKTLGLFGYGRIGRSFHRKAMALGFARTLVCDPALSETIDGIEMADRNAVCQAADVLSLHVPLTPTTHHLIGNTQFALMKPTTILVNASRGGLIDEAALVDALREGRLFGAGLDVFEIEPPNGSPLLELDRVVLSDHTAWYSEESVSELQRKAAHEVSRVLSGEVPQNWVNRWSVVSDPIA